MKKIILAAFVAVASLTANAQWWAGGEVGFNTWKTTSEGHDLGKGHEFTVAPEIGYKLNDKIPFLKPGRVSKIQKRIDCLIPAKQILHCLTILSGEACPTFICMKIPREKKILRSSHIKAGVIVAL